MSQAEFVPTVAEISRRVGEPVHRVEYVIRSRGIKPISWAGNVRIFADAAVGVIAEELRRIRGGRGRISENPRAISVSLDQHRQDGALDGLWATASTRAKVVDA